MTTRAHQHKFLSARRLLPTTNRRIREARFFVLSEVQFRIKMGHSTLCVRGHSCPPKIFSRGRLVRSFNLMLLLLSFCATNLELLVGIWPSDHLFSEIASSSLKSSIYNLNRVKHCWRRSSTRVTRSVFEDDAVIVIVIIVIVIVINEQPEPSISSHVHRHAVDTPVRGQHRP
jgi:hypothetical protein